MRVTLDINVLVSGLLWIGPSNKILKLVEEQKIKLCLTPSILEELHQVLYRPKFLRRIKMCATSPEELIAGVSKSAILFSDIDIPRVVKDDPDDDKIIACAETSSSEYIVTGDPHLLRIKQHRAIFIITPRKFLTLQKIS